MKTVIKNKLYLGISAGLALVLLSGCGGGGGGSGSGASPGAATPAVEPTTTPQAISARNSLLTGDSRKPEDAAKNDPAPISSVAQSSNDEGGVTKDGINVELSFDTVTRAISSPGVSGGSSSPYYGDAEYYEESGLMALLVPTSLLTAPPGGWPGSYVALVDDGRCLIIGGGLQISSQRYNGVDYCSLAQDHIGSQVAFVRGAGFSEPLSESNSMQTVSSGGSAPSVMTVTTHVLDFDLAYKDDSASLTVELDSSNVLYSSELTECIYAGGTCRFAELEKVANGGTYWVDLYVDLAAGVTTQTALSANPNWLAGGVWIYVPDDAEQLEDLEIGAYADGGDPFTQANIARLEGIATYSGFATGTYLEYDDGYEDAGYFDGVVNLDADFDDGTNLGSISGSVESGGFVLTLGSASIENSDSGFFKGTTQATDTDAYGTYTWTGKWGGQFYDNPGTTNSDSYPGAVGGTFGATCTGDENDADGDGCESGEYWSTFVGAFGATQD